MEVLVIRENNKKTLTNEEMELSRR